MPQKCTAVCFRADRVRESAAVTGGRLVRVAHDEIVILHGNLKENYDLSFGGDIFGAAEMATAKATNDALLIFGCLPRLQASMQSPVCSCRRQ